tara:strand:- start:3234 stop:3455 length:222 start_codon:yes stop_codon:yes gene_type:complete
MPEEKKKEKNKVDENLLRKIYKIYENYGIDPDGLDEGDVGIVYDFYSKNPEKLSEDYSKSKELPTKFNEDEII